MQTIQPSDICGICMDECNRDFLYKTCCTFLLCRKCFNQLELESFPNTSNCPGCRQKFTKVTFSVETVNSSAVPRSYCGAILVSEEQDTHVNNCVHCLKKVVRGNMWFETQLGEKFKTLKRKMSVLEDELFIRNTRIRELTHEHRKLEKELSVRNNHILLLQQRHVQAIQAAASVQAAQSSPAPAAPTVRATPEVPEVHDVEDITSYSTDAFSSDESDASETPTTPIAPISTSMTTPPRLERRRRTLSRISDTIPSPLRRSERLFLLASQVE